MLQAILGLLGGSLYQQSSSLQAIAQPNYKVLPWTGDNFTLGHKLREDNLPKFKDKIDETVDFVIIGGGISGLTAAYNLREYNTVLLEQYDSLGGQARGGTYKSTNYSMGSAYLSTIEGSFGELYSKLNIKPIEVNANGKNWLLEGKWYKGLPGNKDSMVYKGLKQLEEDYRTTWQKIGLADTNLPLTDDQLIKLDNTLFFELLKKYDPLLISVIDSFVKSANCGASNQISALAGISSLSEIFEPIYVLPGGNPTLAKALLSASHKAGNKQQRKDCFVWKVEPQTDYVLVCYSDFNGTTHRIKCKHAIITAPPLVSSRIIPDMSDQMKAILLSCKFGSYLVANLCYDKAVFDGGYDNFVHGDMPFCDFVQADFPYRLNKTYKPGAGYVLTIYSPYSPSSSGRAVLMSGNREKLAADFANTIETFASGSKKHLNQVILTRWGHAMVVPRPGSFTKMGKLKSLQADNFTIAHSSSQGLPCAESAIMAGTFAANRALKQTNHKI
jgi:oxygen-dependent protoporphyrinogen oxidase